MGSGFAKMKKQARQMEEKIELMRGEMKTKRISGSSGNGLVHVIINGEKELLEIKIQPDCVDRNDLEGLQDLIQAACENAYAQIPEETPLQLGF